MPLTAEAGYWYVLDDLGTTSKYLSYVEILNECPDGFHIIELDGSTYKEAWVKRDFLENRISDYAVHKENLP